MPRTKPKHLSLTCDVDEVAVKLDTHANEYKLLAMSAFQVGIGFGAKVNVVLAFELREK